MKEYYTYTCVAKCMGEEGICIPDLQECNATIPCDVANGYECKSGRHGGRRGHGHRRGGPRRQEDSSEDSSEESEEMGKCFKVKVRRTTIFPVGMVWTVHLL